MGDGLLSLSFEKPFSLGEFPPKHSAKPLYSIYRPKLATSNRYR